MGEEVRGVPEAAPLAERRGEAASGPDVAAEEAGTPSIGRYLARQRRLRGISIDDLASVTKIPRRSLERLEAGAFDASRDGFARGFVRTVAAALGLDPDEAVMRLMSEPPEDERTGLTAGLGPRLPLLGVGLLTLAGLVGALLWMLLSALLAASPEPSAPEVVLRHDPVRALATEAATLSPEPEPEPAPAQRAAEGSEP